ncbi:hypothetical protein IIA28_04375 [candidate division KSB1 bacterium]|nr:hypothetical protein [candidate division KSB1 bacterium]
MSSKIENPFDLTLQEFIHLDAHSKRKIFINAAQLNSSFVNSYFRKHPEIDWLVIAQKKNNIVESGSRENEPYEQYLAEKYRVPVFTYSRQKIVEEPAFQ